MKLMIASDLHGAADDCRAMLRAYDREGPRITGPRRSSPCSMGDGRSFSVCGETARQRWIRWC